MKRVLLVMALLAITAVGAAVAYQSAARDREYRQLMAQADSALASSDTLAATEDYSGALVLRPDSMLAHLRRGETYRQRGDLDNAARDFREASALDPTATRPLEELGDTLYQQQRYKAAVEAYEGRLRLDDRSGAIRYRIGLAHYRDRNLDTALKVLRDATRLEPQLADAHYLAGVCLREKGNAAEALTEFQKAVQLSPGSVPAREELADLFASLNRNAEAIEQLDVLAALDSRLERRVAIGLAHARAGHLDLAVLTLGSAIERAPDQPVLYGALGRVWLDIAETREDRPDAIGKALEALARAASSPTATSDVKTLYGRALADDHQLDAAEQVLQQATERFPVDPAAFAELATVAEQLKHYETARTALVSYNALVGDDQEFSRRALKIGLLSISLNDPSTAMAWLTRASATAPEDLKTLVALAEAELNAGRRDRAQATLKRGLRIDPANIQLRTPSRRLL
jgi:tetratricopeptide (TPR) repeat protein